jgi:hypothetical protein
VEEALEGTPRRRQDDEVATAAAAAGHFVEHLARSARSA